MDCAKPLITIGVCVKNSAATIRATIESIINQDFPYELMEVIFVDDGSVDATPCIIREYISKMQMRVKFFKHDWRGLGYSRNLVVQYAEGNYIVWVDGDMIIEKDFVRKQVKFMEKHPTVGIAKGFPKLLNYKNPIGFLENIGLVTYFLKNYGVSNSKALGTGGSIYRVKAIRQVGGFDISQSGVGEDIDAESKIRRAGWLTYLGNTAFFIEQPRDSIISAWKEGVWHGYGNYFIFRKDKKIFSLVKMNPIASYIAGATLVPIAYKLTRRKIIFLMPFYSMLKRAAWNYGFFRNQIAHIISEFKNLFVSKGLRR
jgi:glycosyltransferase involved in cell wall biosynthesis